jgi:dihydrofolate reductase
MRRLVVTQNITLDGSIEMLGDWFDPHGQGDQSDLREELLRQDSEADGFLVGRRTFTDLRGYWPQQTDDATGVTDYLNQVQNGRDIVCTGSIRLTHALIGAGLVDEYRLFVYPAVQGRGRRLFPDGYEASGLRLLESRALRSGITLQRYAAAA